MLKIKEDKEIKISIDKKLSYKVQKIERWVKNLNINKVIIAVYRIRGVFRILRKIKMIKNFKEIVFFLKNWKLKKKKIKKFIIFFFVTPTYLKALKLS